MPRLRRTPRFFPPSDEDAGHFPEASFDYPDNLTLPTEGKPLRGCSGSSVLLIPLRIEVAVIPGSFGFKWQTLNTRIFHVLSQAVLDARSRLPKCPIWPGAAPAAQPAFCQPSGLC